MARVRASTPAESLALRRADLPPRAAPALADTLRATDLLPLSEAAGRLQNACSQRVLAVWGAGGSFSHTC